MLLHLLLLPQQKRLRWHFFQMKFERSGVASRARVGMGHSRSDTRGCEDGELSIKLALRHAARYSVPPLAPLAAPLAPAAPPRGQTQVSARALSDDVETDRAYQLHHSLLQRPMSTPSAWREKIVRWSPTKVDRESRTCWPRTTPVAASAGVGQFSCRLQRSECCITWTLVTHRKAVGERGDELRACAVARDGGGPRSETRRSRRLANLDGEARSRAGLS